MTVAIVAGAHGQTASPATAQTTQTTVVAEADAFVDAGRPNRNFGYATRLHVAASTERRSYLRFDVPAVDGTIRRAVLRVRVDAGSSLGFDVRGVGSTTWSEGGVTYRTAPAMAT
ncbi:MAG TPA: DNRLRE domain-containing protein, partial [Solirubrobacteraceae bacterium]|nr:DNRLRE domain-containing protein [Solirubrobacteraceae bacterium]